MDKAKVTNIVREIVEKLVAADYITLANNDVVHAITAEELKMAIDEYPGTITLPPETAFNTINIFVVNYQRVGIDMDLWFDNKRSDLTLSCTLREIDGKVRYEIENIHIL